MIKTTVLLLIGSFALLAANKGEWKITLLPKAELKADAEIPFEVKLSDSKGKPLEGAQVEVVLTMIDMDHGEFKSAAKESKPGVYLVKPKFMMGGNWNVEVRAKKGAQSAVNKVQLLVKE